MIRKLFIQKQVGADPRVCPSKGRTQGFAPTVILIIALIISACSALVGSESTNSVGDFDLDAESDIISFDASSADYVYHSILFSNNSSGSLAVTGLVFYNNVCNDFSLHNITDESGLILADDNDALSLAVGADQKISLNIRYAPSNCTYSGYETTMYVYYQEGSTTFRVSVILKPTGSGGGSFACDHLFDQSEDYTETGLSTFEDGTFYLRADRMRGYMYLPSSTIEVNPSDLSVGTDINVAADAFITPFLEVVAAGETITLSEITDDVGFCLPSPEDNQAFGGVMSLLTSSGPFTGAIDSEGNSLIEDLGVTIRAEDIPDGLSLGIDSDSVFQISLVTDLSTAQVPAEGATVSTTLTDGLTEAGALTDDDDDPLLPIDSEGGRTYLEGTPLNNGQITLVGIGTFTNEDDTYVGSDPAKTFLIDNEAYIFISIEATVMQKK